MTLADLIIRLDHAGFDVDAGQLLDAFWLASLGRDLSLKGPVPVISPVASGDALARSGTARSPRRRSSPALPAPVLPAVAPPAMRVPLTPVFARGDMPPVDSHENASLVSLPAPPALSDRLALMRALRPLTQRWPSRTDREVDEEGTVEAIARMGAGATQPVSPVFRSRGERWFEVELVLEDDASVELWTEVLREYAEVLRESGVFRAVSVWRLRVRSAPAHGAYLESLSRARISTDAFLGKAARRLIIFASNGASAKWADGRYATILSAWSRDNAVLLLQLSAPGRWARSRLGEPHGLVSTVVPGANGAALRIEADWWQTPQAVMGPGLIPLPVIDLTSTSLSRWAEMQMARGHAHPAYLLKIPRPDQASSRASPDARRNTAPSIERVMSALQYESPQSFRLATFLCTAPFTLSVARLIQAIAFDGSTDPDMLAELMRSGVVVDISPTPSSESTMAGTYFRVRPEAAERLLRSLRRSDAAELGREVQRRVSSHLAALTGSKARSLELIADDAGRQRLPTWARPFAHVARSLLGMPENAEATLERFQRFVRSIPLASVRAIVSLAAENRLLPELLEPELWTRLSLSGLIYQTIDGTWAFAPDVRELFASLLRGQPQGAQEARSVTAVLDVLQSMALAFHVGQLPGVTGGLHGVRETLSDWTGERAAALAHWTAMSEYVFAGSVTQVLATGDDPLAAGDVEVDLQTLNTILDACELTTLSERNAVQPTRAWAQLRLAVRLLSQRQPDLFGGLLLPWIDDDVWDFVEDEDGSRGSGTRWRQAAPRTIEWAHDPEAARAVAPYTNAFFQRFLKDGWSGLALSKDFSAYLQGLLATWGEASKEILSRGAMATSRIYIKFPIASDSFRWIRSHLPAIDIRRERASKSGIKAGGRVDWTVSATSYLELIVALGSILHAAVQRRLARRRWQPKVLWVDDQLQNSEVERERLLNGCHIDYTDVTSKEEALLLCRSVLFDAVITNMGRRGDVRADGALLDALRQQKNNVPFVVYSAGQRPEHVTEAVHHSAVGIAENFEQLDGFVLEALLRYDEALDRAFSPDMLLQYTERRFPGRRTSGSTNWLICRDIDETEFRTLLDVDRALDAASGAIATLARSEAQLFKTGTDYVLISLALVSKRFLQRYDFTADMRQVLVRHVIRSDTGSLAANERNANNDAMDESAKTHLANTLGELVTEGRAAMLNDQLQRALGDAVDAGNWFVDANSQFSFESENEYAQLDSWKFLDPIRATFVPINYVNGNLAVTTHIILSISVYSDFSFFVTDSIDKDQVSMGHTQASRQVERTVRVDLEVANIDEESPIAESIDVEALSMRVDFGYVKPDDWASGDK